ncbi:hypothetical protein PB01_09945 [Psychrobacillus glaciei]|uniref:Uncharacterized protein n=1 Tax=Psychrobacillus glaciei TaxID=2283160 RepID=A0A5J6SQQ1_9BACI|nr:hypothetical protein [Psychrobacillus glaciei]QFF99124.1 hypothetical protein PB01_09945 [Psychrobacillus glaciei]
MWKTFTRKLKAFVPYFFVMIVLGSLSYILVYQASFLPNGYKIISQQNNELTIKLFNLIGKEKSIQTISLGKDDAWKVEQIEYDVKRQNDSLWMIFSFVSISATLIVMYVRNGMRVWKAIFQSNLIFAILIPLVSLKSAWHSIQSLISR